jgi:uncharacterized protein YcbK (DUF882 family)
MGLTKNFSKSEFECKCGCEMPKDVLENIKEVANQLQFIRNQVEKPIKINSAYRCLEHNRSIGSNDTSQHVLGKAVDIVIAEFIPIEVNNLLDVFMESGDIKQGGLGLYNTFVHYDIRGTKSRWDYAK